MADKNDDPQAATRSQLSKAVEEALLRRRKIGGDIVGGSGTPSTAGEPIGLLLALTKAS